MAIRTGHLSFWDRMVRRLVGIRTLLLVTGVTNLRLCLLVTHLVMAGMHLVTAGTSNIIGRVGASIPVHVLATLMARCTNSTLFTGRQFRFFAKISFGSRTNLDAFRLVSMRIALAMAAYTTRSASILGNTVLGLGDRQNRYGFIFVVATRTFRIALVNHIFAAHHWRLAVGG